MKKITLLIAFLITSVGFSQQVLIEDFETAPTIEGFEGLTSASFEAAPSGSNATSFKLVSNTDGQPWQGAQVDLASGTLIDLTTDKTIKMDVYSTTAFSLMVKVEDKVNDPSAVAAANTQNHTGSGWETLTFTFTTGSDGTATANGDYSRVVFFPNRNSADNGWNDPKVDITVFVDNITGVKKTVEAAKELVEDFETSPTVEGFEGITSATVEASSVGSNGNSFKLVTNTDGQPWQGAQVDLVTGTVLDITSDKTITVDVYATTAFSLMVKVEDKINSPAAAAAANTQNHTGSGWETLTFTFTTGSDGTATANGDYSRVVFFPNRNSADNGWNDPKIDITIYVDNIKGIKKSTTPPPADPLPTTAAPSPTNSDTNILSIYNDTGAFKGISNTWASDYTFGENKGDVDLDDTDGVNNALKMDFSVAGWGAGTNAPVDITGMTHIHFDYYAPAGDAGESGHEFKFIIIGDGQGEMDYVIKETGGDAVIQFDKWVSVDVPLSHYQTLGLTLDKFLQYKLGSSSDLNTKIVYFDNIYIYNSATAGVENNKLSDFSIYPNPATDMLNIATTSGIQSADIFNILGKKVKSFISNNSGSFNVADLSSGVYLVKFISDNKIGTAKFIKK
jgi:hypothetical protein